AIVTNFTVKVDFVAYGSDISCRFHIFEDIDFACPVSSLVRE
ncbi:28241_t:CDS:1, partial [Gigaspora margarita]